jgi:HEAT repeat protein
MAKKGRAAAQLLAELGASPEYRARQIERERLSNKQLAEWQRAEVPLVQALESTGVRVSTVWDLVNRSDRYPEAVSILLDHVARPYPERVREGIARALAVRESSSEWPHLRALFEGEPAGNVKWALGCALAASADPDHLPQIVEIIKDTRHGYARVALLDAVAQIGTTEAKAYLKTLRSDPELRRAIRLTLKRHHIKV